MLGLTASAHLLVALALLLLPGSSWAIVCYHCDSIALPECAQTLGEVGLLPYVDCPADLTCAMSIVDSITYRGCGADTPITGATYSKSCSSNLCNGGVYPPGRLKCHHCAGSDCVTAPAGKPKPCLYHLEEDQCYTDVASSSEAYRGCVSEHNHTLSSAAQVCDINGCNEEQGAWAQTCARCDSLTGRGCKMDLFLVNTGKCNVTQYEECQQEVLLGEPEDKFCFSYRNLNRVVRGCSTALPSDLQPFVQDLDKCRTGEKCNAGCIARQSCLSCNSLEQTQCRTNVTAISNSTCGSAEASSCFACEYDDWSIQRGCGAPPAAGAGILNCYECDEAGGCNRKDFSRCYSCSSDQAGAGCVNWQVPGGISIEECAEPAAACLVATFANGTTARGCERADFSCSSPNATNCRRCEGSFCNKGAFPEQRLWCHQCSGQACAEIARGQTATPCPLLANEPEDQKLACLEYFDTHSEQVVRGCRSNSELYYECLLRSSHSENCRTCRTEACNNSPAKDLRTRFDAEAQALALLQARSSAKPREMHVVGLLFSLLYGLTRRH